MPAHNAVRSEGRQLRLALSMNGGVSLAVWIGGCVAEIDALRRTSDQSDPFWREVLDAGGYRDVHIDVLSGASAGGLNSVLLAEVMRHPGAAFEFRKLWEDAADIDRLLKAPENIKRDEVALLNGQFFWQQLKVTLEHIRTKGTCTDQPQGASPGSDDCELFASATLLVPFRSAYREVPGAPLDETQSDAYFHVARRGTSDRGLDGFATRDNDAFLATIGRSTSSIPLLFEPMKITEHEAGSRLVGAFDPVEVAAAAAMADVAKRDRATHIVDGGLIDNVPIARAIRAIASARSDLHARRVLVYLHPDPGSTPTNRPKRMTFAEVRKLSMKKRKESLREDVEELRLHNDRVRARRAQVLDVLKPLVSTVAAKSASPTEATMNVDLVTAIEERLLLGALVDPAAALAWHAPEVPRLGRLCDRSTASNDSTESTESPAATGGDTVESFRNALRATSSSAPLLVAESLRRCARTVLGLLHIVEDDPAIDSAGLGEVHDRFKELALLGDVVTSYQVARFLGYESALGRQCAVLASGEPDRAVARLVASSAEVARCCVDDGNASISDDGWRALATWKPIDAGPGASPSPAAALLQTLFERATQSLTDAFQRRSPDAPSDALAALHAIASGAVSMRRLDAAVQPISLSTSVGDQLIDAVRIAGSAESPMSERFKASFDGNPKIAGLGLHHLAAFFATSWRTNDWRWGRLDAVGPLIDAILGPPAPGGERSRNALIEKRQEQLIAEFLREDVAEGRTAPRKRRLARDQAGADPNDTTGFVQRWANEDRRFTSLLGQRRSTSTALRAVIGAVKLVATENKAVAYAAQPVLLAGAGFTLAGRKAAVGIAATLGLLMAPRMSGLASFVSLGLAVVLSVLAFVVTDRVLRVPRGPYDSLLYVVTGCILAFSGWLVIGDSDGWRRWPSSGPFVHGAPWIVAAVAAGISAVVLFFWMRTATGVVLTVITSAMYGAAAWRAERIDCSSTTFFARLAGFWPAHKMWVIWLIAIMGFPFLIGRLPSSWVKLRERHPS